MAEWQFWIDRGGTFTDVVALDPSGVTHTAKLLSEAPTQYADAATEAIRRLTGNAGHSPLELRIGTTVATNALLEREGEPVCLAITSGFEDALTIGYQERPDLFCLDVARRSDLHSRVVAIDERVSAAGEVLTPFDSKRARSDLQRAFDEGFRALAIVLVHGYRFTAHEAELLQIASDIGFTQISASHLAAPIVRLIARGDTTVVDAYLSPVLGNYIERLRTSLAPDAETLFMQSNGGLVDAVSFQGKDAILSGPAGGVVGVAATAREAGFEHVVGFDMGGTSTDVSYYAGAFERDGISIVAGARISVPMLRIHTVAAGGGSICGFKDGRFTVGPASAGAIPGPACYARGGPLTITDCNVVLGKIQPDFLPPLFGPAGDQSLDVGAAQARLEELVALAARDLNRVLDPREVAEGLLQIAVSNMANAIKKISISRGHDVSRAVLGCFGGAGGQHACLVADALDIDTVMVHPFAGVLSALGMGLADRRTLLEAPVDRTLDPDAHHAVRALLDQLAADASSALGRQGSVSSAIEVERRIRLRFEGSDAVIEVPYGPIGELRQAFATAFETRYGYVGAGLLIVDSVSAEAILRTAPVQLQPPAHDRLVRTGHRVTCWMGGQALSVPTLDRSELECGAEIGGPALIFDPVSTTVVEPGWRARVDGRRNLILHRSEMRRKLHHVGSEADPVRLEIFNGLFMNIAEEMGAALQSAARSVNIRERLDFSCAIFDRDGHLVANAPHMPVHLGSMGESIRTVIERRAKGRDGRGMRRGDAYAINAPFAGGTHLPDITVILPVFVGADRQPDFFVAARGHHADVGGISPGSMPPHSATIDQEGILFDNVLIREDGRFLEREVRAILSAGAWPARDPDQNIADLAAQIAACTFGARQLVLLSNDYGLEVVSAYMEHVQAQAERAVARVIGGLRSGSFEYEMDDGAFVRVRADIDAERGTMHIDFTGTSAQRANNFNAPLSIVRAAALYVMRCLVDEPIPMNDGCLRRVRLTVPEGSMLNPRWPAAVVAGNVETSQVVTDALFGALGVLAGSQGTMNNFTFGNAQYQYYETIAGGAGAGPSFDGESAIQTHMTNSRLTDPEILETRYPVLLESFSIRRGSGGRGLHNGGAGVVRRVRFREAMVAGILANRRRVPPFGLKGGGNGACGANRVERADGRVEQLDSTAAVEVAPGDVMVIETPGGGGYGSLKRPDVVLR